MRFSLFPPKPKKNKEKEKKMGLPQQNTLPDDLDDDHLSILASDSENESVIDDGEEEKKGGDVADLGPSFMTNKERYYLFKYFEENMDEIN